MPLAFVLILTLILLTRAFRSIALAIKAALLNLVSLAAAFGVVVLVSQQGHGSSLRQGSRARARANRQARHQRRLILVFAFLVLSTSPRLQDQAARDRWLAAGIILDATVIRALLVPALMRLHGDANWWTPKRTRVVFAFPTPSRHRRSRP